MNHVTKTVENIAHEWKSFIESNENQIERVKSLETELKNIKGEVINMQNTAMPDVMYDLEEKNRLNGFMRGEIGASSIKSFSSDQDERGGFAVTAEKYKDIIAKLEEISPMRKLASCQTISSNVLELLIQKGEFDCGWVSERQERDETDAPKLIQKRIAVHEVYSQPKATQRLLDDSYVNLESWLTEQIVQSFASAENAAFIKGDGNNKPKGFLAYEAEIERIEPSEEEKILPVDIINLLNALTEPYHANASFLMNRRTLAEIQKLQDENGRFIWQASMSEKMPDTIFGIPVFCSNDMPAPEAGKSVIALADFKAAYKIVDRLGLSIMKDPFTEKPFVKFYATKRVGGDVVDFNAIKLLKI